ncbi:MAG: type II toxin-antitoxin system death-on-curing family toxin [Candidatus Eisenbacteria bacterium]|nr:type II toxin-antitoxin system death-on-curing family toxin [Candidatus Eisenbacteria bacterium]
MPGRRRQPTWVDRVVIDAIHLDTIRAHGGLPGVRDENALESALARPQHRWADGRRVDLAGLAATYGFGLARNHWYRDGNKRVAFLAMLVFLGLNGFDLEAPEPNVVTVMLMVAAGDLSEAALAKWLRVHLVPQTEP